MAVNLTVDPVESTPHQSTRNERTPHESTRDAHARSMPALRLRPWRPGDLADLLDAHRDPEMRRRLTAPLDDEAAAARWIEAQEEGWSAGHRYSFAVLADAEGVRCQLVGGVGVKEVEPEEGSGEVGYWVAAAHRGRGVASRALEAVSQWALEPEAELPHGLGLLRLDLLHSADNPASCAVAEKAGYGLRSVLDPLPPRCPGQGHLHTRVAA